MPTYIVLFNFTEQGIKVVKDVKKHQEKAVQRAEALGVKITDIYMTMGQYDGVTVCECPDDETAVAGAIAAALDGHIRTTTLRAFSPEEFAGIVGKLS